MDALQWRSSADIKTLKARAEYIKKIRHFFDERGFTEVETPYLAQHGVTDPHLTNIKATVSGKSFFLQTSPEYHMKRLLACGLGPIYQLARAFRDDECGRFHNPEFLMLEWYQLGIDHLQLLEEIDDLLQSILRCSKLKIITYQEAFISACDIDPFNWPEANIYSQLKRFKLHEVFDEAVSRDNALYLLMSHVVEPWIATFDTPIAIIDFPPSQAALAKIINQRAARFEIYYHGIELANGYYELTAFDEQYARFAAEKAICSQQNLAWSEPDIFYLAALKHGLPKCSGVALGVDRLLMCALNKTHIKEVMTFNIENA